MCGIVGMTATRQVAGLMVEGLRRLEYRGYDSAGIATVTAGKIAVCRAVGKLGSLADKLATAPLAGHVGIGHTRWATHGKPTERNAHPHCSDLAAVVHNGIIENYRELREELTGQGHTFSSDTDTEAIVHLISHGLQKGLDPKDAVTAALKRLEGSFAIGVVFAGHDDLLICARRGSPLAIGHGDGEMYIGSDAMAMASLTDKITYLEDGDWAELTPQGAIIHDHSGAVVERKVVHSALSGDMIGKGQYRHFMLKEIFEQPAVIASTITAFEKQIALPFDWKTVSRITLLACGTASYAALVGRYWFEQLAGIAADVDVASEFRYREAPLSAGGVAIAVSQSGETADTLAAINYARSREQKIVAIVNVAHSSIARLADAVLTTPAGPEIGVASTKAFTTQLTVLLLLAIAAGRARGHLNEARADEILQRLREVPARIDSVLSEAEHLQDLARKMVSSRDALYLGRGLLYPIALEGALKLKEISYIHAEGYPAGELKHGPIALIDENMPVILLAHSGLLFDKTASNLQEVAARGGKTIVFADKAGIANIGITPFWSMTMPECDPIVAPLVYAVPMQLLAYYTAVAKGTDVDQPRNLAKSVTVE